MQREISKCEQKLINFLKINGFTKVEKQNLKDIFSQAFSDANERSKCFVSL